MTNVTKTPPFYKINICQKKCQKPREIKASGILLFMFVCVCFCLFLLVFELHKSCRVAQKVAQDQMTIDDIFDLVFSFFWSKWLYTSKTIL